MHSLSGNPIQEEFSVKWQNHTCQ